MTRPARAGAIASLMATALLLGVSAPDASAQTAELRVLSSNGVKAVLNDLLPRCEQTIGHKTAIEFGTSASLRQRIDDGEAVDVVILTTEAIADLAAAGHVVGTSSISLGRSGIGIGIRAGGRRFDISTPDAIKRSFLSARSVTYARDGASRAHIERMFERLGIAEQMSAKTLLDQGSVRAAAKVVAGEAELLLTLVSEILPVEGIELLGPLPAEFQSYVSFGGAVGTRSPEVDAGKALLQCLSGPGAAPAFEANGLELRGQSR
jgi:molybdate transport system substrate-binding protein